MLGVMKKVTLRNGKEVEVYDLTLGFMADVEGGVTVDTVENIILNSTDLTIEQIQELRKSEATEIVGTALQLTYPELYDENGNHIKQDTDDTSDDKKKV